MIPTGRIEVDFGDHTGFMSLLKDGYEVIARLFQRVSQQPTLIRPASSVPGRPPHES